MNKKFLLLITNVLFIFVIILISILSISFSFKDTSNYKDDNSSLSLFNNLLYRLNNKSKEHNKCLINKHLNSTSHISNNLENNEFQNNDNYYFYCYTIIVQICFAFAIPGIYNYKQLIKLGIY